MATLDPAELAPATTLDPAELARPATLDPAELRTNTAPATQTALTAPAATSTTQQPPASRTFTQSLARDLLKNYDDLAANLNETAKAPTVLGKIWGGIKTVGSGLSIPFTPVETAVSETIGQAVEQATGGRISAGTVGEVGSLGAQLLLDPINVLGAGAKAVGSTRVGQNIAELLSPATRSAKAQRAADIVSREKSYEDTAIRRIKEQLEPHRALLNRLPESERIAFQDRIMMGARQLTPELQTSADTFRRIADRETIQIQRLGQKVGRNLLQDANENWLGVIWRPRDKVAREAEEAAARSGASLRGRGDFLKKKKYKTITEGLNDPAFSAEFELATKDPIEMMMMKFREQRKFLHGTEIEWSLKQEGITKFKRLGDAPAPGWQQMPDRAFKAIAPPAKFVSEHETAFDKGLREGLHRVGEFLGLKIRHPTTKQEPRLQGAYGYTTTRLRDDVVSRFGNESVILEHELGHQIDNIYGLRHKWLGNKAVLHELRQLAMQRAGGAAGFAAQAQKNRRFAQYLMSPPELMANMWHAFWHNRPYLQQNAPTVYREIAKFLNANPPLAEKVLDVKPSLMVQGAYTSEEFRGAGPQLVGAWYAPKEVVDLMNRYLSTGIAHKPVFESLRATGVGLNMLQLGLSAFHATFTTIDVMVSQLARSLESAFHGEFARAGMQALTVPLAPFTNVREGGKLKAALLNPAGVPPEARKMAHAFTVAGGRVAGGAFYRAGENSLVRGLRDGTLMNAVKQSYADNPLAGTLAAPLRIAGAALNDISHPIMEFLVPRQKLGVFSRLAEDYMRRNPNAAPQVFDREMRKIWDSVENRLGLMTYDNVFWNKTMKDVAFLAIRSVGWNLGTVRELGGGVSDAARAISALRNGEQVEFTHRMAYAIALPIVAGTIGASLTYLYTGHGPETLKDYYFPPTGRRTPKGAPERVIVPSYIKDVLEVNNAPVQTAFSKLNPVWSFLYQLYSNRDFYGGIIRDPSGDFDTQAKQFLGYMENQLLPFSVRSFQRMGKEGTPLGQQIGSFAGFQAAPGFITDPRRTEQFQRRSDMIALRKRMREDAGR